MSKKPSMLSKPGCRLVKTVMTITYMCTSFANSRLIQELSGKEYILRTIWLNYVRQSRTFVENVTSSTTWKKTKDAFWSNSEKDQDNYLRARRKAFGTNCRILVVSLAILGRLNLSILSRRHNSTTIKGNSSSIKDSNNSSIIDLIRIMIWLRRL